eukprot:jgi/Botrbrau1/8746/Bobra.0090s0020.1
MMEGSSTDMARELDESWVVVKASSLSNVLQSIKGRVLALLHGRSHTKEDAAQYKEMLHEIKDRWTKDGIFAHAVKEVDPELQLRSATLFTECQDVVDNLENSAQAEMPEQVRSIYEKLQATKGRLQEMKKGQSSLESVQEIQNELDAIDRARLANGGVFGGNADNVPPGQAACSELLNQCYDLVAEVVATAAEPPPAMREVLSNLAGIKAAMIRLKEQGPHTAEDVAHYQGMLDAIDNRRKDGIFCGDLASGEIPAGQAQASALLARCYELVQDLLGSAQEMPDEVSAIYKRLSKIFSDLTAIRLRSSHTTDVVKPLQWALDEIDSARNNGVFGGDLSNIPPGQAVCSNLLNSNYRLVYILNSTATDVEGGSSRAHETGSAPVTATA